MHNLLTSVNKNVTFHLQCHVPVTEIVSHTLNEPRDFFRNPAGLSAVVDRCPAHALAVFRPNNHIHSKLSYGSLDHDLWSSGDLHGLTALSISPW